MRTCVGRALATGTEALRAATYAVAAGAVDFALAMGVEKLKDTGYGGLPLRTKGLASDLWMPYGSARRLRAARRRVCSQSISASRIIWGGGNLQQRGRRLYLGLLS